MADNKPASATSVADRPHVEREHRFDQKHDNDKPQLGDKQHDKKGLSVGEQDERTTLNQFKNEATTRINAAKSQLKEIQQKVLDLSSVAVSDQQKGQFNEITSQIHEARSGLEQPFDTQTPNK